MASAFRLSRYFIILSMVWIAAMTWKIYPQFKDALRADGRVTTLSDYVEEACGQRIGPSAAACIAEASATGHRLVSREQGKSILLIEAPLLGYVLGYLPLRLIGALVPGGLLAGRRRRGALARDPA